jgi:hypothetical protein
LLLFKIGKLNGVLECLKKSSNSAHVLFS